MKLSWKAASLSGTCETLSGVVGEKSPIVMYQHALLDRDENGRMFLLGSNGEVELSVPLPEEVALEGEFVPTLLPIHKVFAAVRVQNSSQDLTLEFDNGELVIHGRGKDEYRFKTLPLEGEFPRIQLGEVEFECALPFKFLTQSLERCIHSIAKNDLRAYLNGVLFEFKEGVISVVSTDGHRLTWSKANLEGAKDQSYILTRLCVDQLTKLLGRAGALNLQTSFGKRGVRFEASGVTLTGKLIAENYPDYRRVVPDPSIREATLSIERSELESLVKRARILASAQRPGVTLFNEGSDLVAEAQNEQGERVRISVPLLRSAGQMRQTFNVDYLSQLLSASRTKTLYGNFGQGVRDGAYFQEEDDEGNRLSEAVFVLMPMNIA